MDSETVQLHLRIIFEMLKLSNWVRFLELSMDAIKQYENDFELDDYDFKPIKTLDLPDDEVHFILGGRVSDQLVDQFWKKHRMLSVQDAVEAFVFHALPTYFSNFKADYGIENLYELGSDKFRKSLKEIIKEGHNKGLINTTAKDITGVISNALVDSKIISRAKKVPIDQINYGRALLGGLDTLNVDSKEQKKILSSAKKYFKGILVDPLQRLFDQIDDSLTIKDKKASVFLAKSNLKIMVTACDKVENQASALKGMLEIFKKMESLAEVVRSDKEKSLQMLKMQSPAKYQAYITSC